MSTAWPSATKRCSPADPSARHRAARHGPAAPGTGARRQRPRDARGDHRVVAALRPGRPGRLPRQAHPLRQQLPHRRPRRSLVLETAGNLWAAKKVERWAISNALTLGHEFDLCSRDPRTRLAARAAGMVAATSTSRGSSTPACYPGSAARTGAVGSTSASSTACLASRTGTRCSPRCATMARAGTTSAATTTARYACMPAASGGLRRPPPVWSPACATTARCWPPPVLRRRAWDCSSRCPSIRPPAPPCSASRARRYRSPLVALRGGAPPRAHRPRLPPAPAQRP